MRRLRVLHINTERTWRGGELQTLQLARGLAERGHASHVVAPPRSPLLERAADAGLPAHAVRMRGEVDPAAVMEIGRHLRRERFDVVHCHTSHAHTLGVLASRMTSVGKRVVSRRVDFSIFRHRLKTSALKYRYGVDRYVTVSHAIRDQLVRDGIDADRIRVVHSGIDPTRFDGIPPAPLRAELSLPPDSRLVGNVAHFGWHKAQEVLVRAARLLARSHPRAVVLLVGDGECRARVEEEARSLGLAGGAVRFLGFRDDVPAILAALDVFVMCSVMEGLCTSILDALAARRPVVASRVGGIPEILEGGNGRLVPPKDPEALAGAIGRFLDDAELARETAERGRRTVEERFSVNAVVEGTLGVYRELLEGAAWIGPARRLLLLVVAVLAPLSAWLIVVHLEERTRLLDEAKGRVRVAAEAGAARIAEVVERTRRALDAQPSGTDPAKLRARFPGATVLVRDVDPDTPRPPETGLRPNPADVLTWVVRVDEAGDLLLRVPVPPRFEEWRSAGWTRAEVISPRGEILLRLPIEERGEPSEQAHRKLSTLATRTVGRGGGSGGNVYRDLRDDEVIGAWHTIPDVGAVVVEEPWKEAMEPIRGPRAWHFTTGLLVLAILPLILLEIARRWSAASSLVRLWAFTKPYWPSILMIVLAMGLYAGGGGAQLFMINLLVEDVLLEADTDAAWTMLLILSAATFVITLLMAGGRFLKDYLSTKVTQSVVNDIRCEVGGHLLTLSLGFYHRRRQGALLSRLTNDVGQSRKSLKLVFGDIVQEPLMLAGAIAAGFATNWRLALMIFVAFPILIIPISRFGRRIKRYARKRQVKRAEVTNVMVQMLSGIRIVKAFRMERHERDRLRASCDRLLRQSIKVARTSALSQSVLELFNSVGAVLIMLAGGYFVLTGQFGITVADLVTFSAILTRMYKPLKDLTKTYNKIQDSLPSIERVFEILDYRPDIEDGPDARALGKPERVLAFEGVSFAYDDEPVLRDIDFEVAVGSVIALVGPTGAGKSTLTDLVARYYDPAEGRITIDGVDLRQLAVGSLLARVAVVTQEPFLFHTTIRENILYGRPDATQEEVEAAAKAAFVHEEILEQPEGYDTVVGDRGSRISGGQRQRITIARAILKDADILILDEATSSLDSRSEGEVQGALANLMEGRTTFVVAHRLSTIRNADRILVLEHGRIVESGTHEELVAAGGLYATLHALQEGGAAEPSPAPAAGEAEHG